MTWRYVGSLVIGFFAALFGLKWFASQRREDRAIVDKAREDDKREKKRIDALERLRHKAADDKLKDELAKIKAIKRDVISVGDALAVLNGESGDDAGSTTDTE